MPRAAPGRRNGARTQSLRSNLSRYTHRVAISNSRLVGITETSGTFKWKDYRASGRGTAKVMTLAIDEFIRRFLIHVLPDVFIASVTTVCSPMAAAPRTSRERVSCSIGSRRTMP